MHAVYKLPNGDLLVPSRADAGGRGAIVGDGYLRVAAGSDDHKRWADWLTSSGVKAEPLAEEAKKKEKAFSGNAPLSFLLTRAAPKKGKRNPDDIERASDGRFGKVAGQHSGGKKKTEKADPDAIAAKLKEVMSGKNASGASVESLGQELMGLTVAQLNKLKSGLGIKATGAKAELAKKIAESALAGGGGKDESPAGGAKKEESAPKKGKADPDAIAAKLKDVMSGKGGGASVDALGQELMSLTVAQLNKLKSGLGLTGKSGKKKEEIARGIAEEAISSSKKSKDEGEDQGGVEGKGGDSSNEPLPPSEGWSGTDTLGREWKDGKLTGKEEEYKDDSAGLGYTPEPPPKEMNIAGALLIGEGPIDPKEAAALVAFVNDKSGGTYTGKAGERLRTLKPELVDNLFKGADPSVRRKKINNGLLSVERATGDVKLTDKGRLALWAAETGHDLSKVPPAATKEVIGQLKELMRGLSSEGRESLADAYGIGAGFEHPTDFATALEVRARDALNTEPIGKRLRAAKDLHAGVAALTRLEAEADAVKKQYLDAGVRFNALQERLDYVDRKTAAGRKEVTAINAEMSKLVGEQTALARRESELRRGAAERLQKTLAGRLAEKGVKAQKISAAPAGADFSPGERSAWEAGAAFLAGGIFADTGAPPMPSVDSYRAKNKDGTPDGRAHYNPNGHKINWSGAASDATMVHEMAHAIEEHNPRINQAVAEFLAHRVKGEQSVSLKEKFGGYGDDETGRKDNFAAAFGGNERKAYYCGKDYGGKAHEILSMGMEEMYRDPASFARNDPEFASFILGVMDGSMLPKEIPDK